MKKNKGFTIVEMMVVITIILILMGLLMPALGRARRRARQIDCLNKLRQLGVALNEYALDNAGTYPAALTGLQPNYWPAANTPTTCPTGGAYNYIAVANEAALVPTAAWIQCGVDHGGANNGDQLNGDGSAVAIPRTW